MCGICGWFDFSATRSADQHLIKAMADAIRHRGPDGEGFHFEPGIGLAHRRLAIIDLSTGEQPMFTENGRVAIVFNGEIFNYRELQHELIARGHAFKTRSDTEVILRSWIEWGSDCVEHLHGQFAIALYDTKDQTFFLARDRLGEKPLYYSILDDGSLIFGSELKALMVDPRVVRKIDPRAVQDFFSLGYVADPKTIYSDVRKLSAGYTLTLKRGGTPRINQYWDPKPAKLNENNIEIAAEALRARLGGAVKSQLVADVPVGAFLSGGVDSSGVTALMAAQVPDALKTFTIGFDDKSFDERGYADMVARRYGVSQFVETVSGNDFASVAALPSIFDEPFGDSSSLPTLRLAQLASRTVKVALSGDGGDELFAGYRRYFFHNREEMLRGMLPQAIRAPIFGFLGRVYPQLDWAPRPLRARQTFRELSCNAAEGYFHNVQVLSDETCARLFSKNLLRQISGYRSSEIISENMAHAASEDPVTIAQYVDLKTWLVGDILTKVDRTAMSCGLEVRVPMLDPEFVEWSLALPRLLKLSGRDGKIVLKKALEPLLPHDILYRRKQGFSVPLAAWFRDSFGLNFGREILQSESLEDYIDIGFVSSLLENHRKGWADNSRALWLIWMFKGFLEEVHTRPAYIAKDVSESVHDLAVGV